MNIALVAQEYPPETARGGIASQTLAKAAGLADLGHRVFVISRSITRQRQETVTGRICVIRIPGMEDRLPEMTEPVQWLAHSLVVAAELTALQKRVALDIVDFPEWAAEGYVYLLNHSQPGSVPVAIHLHGPLVMLAHTIQWPQEGSQFYRFGTAMEAACVQLADAVYSSSACSTRWVTQYYHPGAQHIPTIHVGVDTRLFSPDKAVRDEHPTVIFVGKFVRNKGVEELVDACSRLARDFPKLRLRMIGTGQTKVIEDLKARAMRHGAADLLEFTGYMDAAALPQELCRAHIFAAPSYYEGGPGFVYLEAMACGLPVIGCGGSGVDEVVETGHNGILVPPRDAGALESALKRLLGDPALAGTMGRCARQSMVDKADRTMCLKQLEAFYMSVIRKRQERGAL